MPDHDQIAELSRLLHQQQRELLELEQTADEAAAVVELDQSRVGRLSRMDALQAQAISQQRIRRREQQLNRIAAALVRIERGDYGFCDECGDEIAFRRLKFDPTATLCINCANERT